jgi:hypothetical protein
MFLYLYLPLLFFINEQITKKLPLQSVSTNVVSLNPPHGEVYSMQLYVIKFVRDLWQISGFL